MLEGSKGVGCGMGVVRREGERIGWIGGEARGCGGRHT